jgi:transposase InsO family protein
VLNIVDDYSKLSPAIEVDTSLPGLRVMRTLERAIDLHGKPKLIVMDNGPEFTCRALDEWASSQGIALHWIDPGSRCRTHSRRASTADSAKSAWLSTKSCRSTTRER